MLDDNQWMRKAVEQAIKAEQQGEVPVGAVAVYKGSIIGEGYNQCITLSDPSAHAEIQALRSAGKAIGNYRLVDVDLYVTLEPCAMCVGAIHHARIRRLIVGANDPKSGCSHTVLPLLNETCFFHEVELTTEVMETECSQLLKNFFKSRRAR
jgi:tRNA(adenine34) deaminase